LETDSGKADPSDSNKDTGTDRDIEANRRHDKNCAAAIGSQVPIWSRP